MPIALLAAAALLAAPASPSAAAAPDFEQAVLEALNYARTRPQDYALILKAHLNRFTGRISHERDGDLGEVTQEGPEAVQEAMLFVQSSRPLGALRFDANLARSAAALADDQSRTGALGHSDSQGRGPGPRIALFAPGASDSAEIVSYGRPTPEAVVRQFIIDEGVRGRTHRMDVYEARFTRAGVACAPHPRWQVVCVVDLAR